VSGTRFVVTDLYAVGSLSRPGCSQTVSGTLTVDDRAMRGALTGMWCEGPIATTVSFTKP
jgi:hypothetical protein